MSAKKEAYMKELQARIDEWDAEMDKLKAKAEQAEAESKLAYYKKLEELRARRRDAEDKIARVQEAGDGAWEDLKEGLENSWEILKTSLTKAKADFERGYRQGRTDDD